MVDSISSFKTAQIQAEVQMAVAAKVLKIARGQGEALVEMVSDAAENMEELIVDVANDMGSEIDAYA